MDIEEAIKILRKQLINTIEASECGLATRGEFKEEIEAIETVLKELEEMKIEKQEINKIFEKACELYENREIYDAEEVLNMFIDVI